MRAVQFSGFSTHPTSSEPIALPVALRACQFQNIHLLEHCGQKALWRRLALSGDASPPSPRRVVEFFSGAEYNPPLLLIRSALKSFICRRYS